jgi:hypothetical protein
MQLSRVFSNQSPRRFLAAAAVFLFVVALAHAQATLIIPQVADGGGFQTEFVLSNTTTAVATVVFTCFEDTTGGQTTNWNLPILETGSMFPNVSIAAAGTVFLHTPGVTTAPLSEGWCQLQTGAGVVAYALFTQFVPGRPNQYGTAPAAPSASRVLVPFDNTAGFVTSIAIANTTNTAETVSVSTQTDTGTIAQETSLTLPANGQMAFTIPTQFGTALNNERGVAEFSTTGGGIAILALAFNSSGSFTASPVYAEPGPALIGAAPAAAGVLQASSLSFQPTGLGAGNVTATFSVNPGNATYSVSLDNGSLTFTDGTFSNQGLALTASALQTSSATPPFGFFTDAGSSYLVSSASLSVTLIPSVTLPAGPQLGALMGTLTVVGIPYPNVGPAVTLSGPIAGSYESTLPN